MLRIDRYLVQLGFITAMGAPTGFMGRVNLYEISDGDPVARGNSIFRQGAAREPQGDFGAVLLDSMDASLIAGSRGLDEVARDGPAVGLAFGAGDRGSGGCVPGYAGADAHASAYGSRGAHQAPQAPVFDGVLRGARWDDRGAGGQDPTLWQGPTHGFDRAFAADDGRGLPDFQHLGVAPPRYGPAETEVSRLSSGPSLPSYGTAPPPPPRFQPTKPGTSYGDQQLMDSWGGDDRKELLKSWNMGPRIHGGNHPRDPGELPPAAGPELLLEG